MWPHSMMHWWFPAGVSKQWVPYVPSSVPVENMCECGVDLVKVNTPLLEEK